MYEKGDDGSSTKTVTAGSDLIGLNIPNFLISDFTEDWTKRDEMIIIPSAVAAFAPTSSYSGEVIETEPETDPVTEPITDPVTNPVTEKPAEETKKPVETKAPDTQSSGGCGGFTVIATAILVAVAGFSTAIIIKQR